jgi:hypothetical protein
MADKEKSNKEIKSSSTPQKNQTLTDESSPPVTPQHSSTPPELPMYTLTINYSSDGRTTPGPNKYKYPAGQQVTITPFPDAGYFFKNWTINRETKNTSNPLTLSMDSDKSVSANFESTANQSEQKQVWGKDRLSQQIRRIDEQITVALKQHGGDHDKYSGSPELIREVRADWNWARVNFSNDKYSDTEKNVSDSKDKLIEVINKLNLRWRLQYYISVWGLFPISIGAFGIIGFLCFLKFDGSSMILGVVPLWAVWAAGLGASAQILVGVVNDYKKDCLITDYKRTWYIVIIFVSLAFGFLAFLLIQAGLITVSQGQFMINPTNATALSSPVPNAASTLSSGTVALPLIVCFLAGYATEWFMGIIGKLTS